MSSFKLQIGLSYQSTFISSMYIVLFYIMMFVIIFIELSFYFISYKSNTQIIFHSQFDKIFHFKDEFIISVEMKYWNYQIDLYQSIRDFGSRRNIYSFQKNWIVCGGIAFFYFLLSIFMCIILFIDLLLYKWIISNVLTILHFSYQIAFTMFI